MRYTSFVQHLVMFACFQLATPSLTAQTFTNLHSFSADPYPYTNIDGVSPEAAFISSGNTLYGTAADGGSLAGTIFAVNIDGTGFTNLHSFAPTAGFPSTNSDGASPVASLCLLGSTLYGVTSLGTTNGNGNIFKIGTNGSGFAVLHTFMATSGPNLTNIDGAQPRAGLLVSGQTLYGTAESGGGFGLGTIFKMDIEGSNFVTLHTFTNHDGAQPLGDLVLSGDVLYGTTASGGHFSQGNVFAMRTNGASFTNLYSFPAASGSPATNSDGASPHAGLILSGNLLYGTAFRGGSAGNGTVFGVSTNGTTFTNLHTFTAISGSAFTNDDGASPQSELVLSGGILYGTAFSGGDFGNGTVFEVATNGMGFTALYQFTATTGDDSINTDGANPSAGLVLSGNSLYGPAANGGTAGNGTIFGLELPVANPQLTISRGGTGVILTWTPTAGFSLQSAPDLASTFTNLPGATSPFTNAIGNPQQFFQLKGN